MYQQATKLASCKPLKTLYLRAFQPLKEDQILTRREVKYPL